jgi:hypothetical protein
MENIGLIFSTGTGPLASTPTLQIREIRPSPTKLLEVMEGSTGSKVLPDDMALVSTCAKLSPNLSGNSDKPREEGSLPRSLSEIFEDRLQTTVSGDCKLDSRSDICSQWIGKVSAPNLDESYASTSIATESGSATSVNCLVGQHLNGLGLVQGSSATNLFATNLGIVDNSVDVVVDRVDVESCGLDLGLGGDLSLGSGSRSDKLTISREGDGTGTGVVLLRTAPLPGAVLASGSGPGGVDKDAAPLLDTAGNGILTVSPHSETPSDFECDSIDWNADDDEDGGEQTRQRKRSFGVAFPEHGSQTSDRKLRRGLFDTAAHLFVENDLAGCGASRVDGDGESLP